MADKGTEETHESVQIPGHIRTARDRVFFPGEALVDERTADEIEAAQKADAALQQAREDGVTEESELGDTRTSKERGKAKSRGSKGSRK